MTVTFALCTYNGHSSLPCISHFASFLQNSLIAWKERPRCLYLKTKRALSSLLLLLFAVYINLRREMFVMNEWMNGWNKHGLVWESSQIYFSQKVFAVEKCYELSRKFKFWYSEKSYFGRIKGIMLYAFAWCIFLWWFPANKISVHRQEQFCILNASLVIL